MQAQPVGYTDQLRAVIGFSHMVVNMHYSLMSMNAVQPIRRGCFIAYILPQMAWDRQRRYNW